MNALNTTFSRNLRGYLSAARRISTLGVKRISRATQAMPSDAVEPIDAVFSNVPDDNAMPSYSDGFQSINQNVLANTVVENLLQLQNEIANGDSMFHAMESPNAQAVRAYQHTQRSYSAPDQALPYHRGLAS